MQILAPLILFTASSSCVTGKVFKVDHHNSHDIEKIDNNNNDGDNTYPDADEFDQDKRYPRRELRGQGWLPFFIQPSVANWCHTLVGDMCPQKPKRVVEYDEDDDSDHPIMGNVKKHDVHLVPDERLEGDLKFELVDESLKGKFPPKHPGKRSDVKMRG